ncbi:MAG TPA: MaoC family dehydratase [Ktedonobacteraceae bacterium]
MAQEPSPPFRRGPTRIGEHIVEQRVLTVEEIGRFATLCGDLNPLHHDEDYARQTRFGGVIACGPQVTSLMMGMTATYFSREGAMLGLEFTFRFRKAVKAGERITMDWEILSAVYKASLQGEIVTLQGIATNPQGEVVLEGQGKILAVDQL